MGTQIKSNSDRNGDRVGCAVGGFDAAMATMSEFVPVTFAESLAHARMFKRALEGQGILTLVDEGLDDPVSANFPNRRIPVLVPQEWQDEASEWVAHLEWSVQAGYDEDEEGELEEEMEDEEDDFYDDDELDDDFEDEDDDFYEDEEEELDEE